MTRPCAARPPTSSSPTSTRPSLDDAAAHHLGRVLRLRDGAVVTVTDGAGRGGLPSRRTAWRWTAT